MSPGVEVGERKLVRQRERTDNRESVNSERLCNLLFSQINLIEGKTYESNKPIQTMI